MLQLPDTDTTLPPPPPLSVSWISASFCSCFSKHYRNIFNMKLGSMDPALACSGPMSTFSYDSHPISRGEYHLQKLISHTEIMIQLQLTKRKHTATKLTIEPLFSFQLKIYLQGDPKKCPHFSTDSNKMRTFLGTQGKYLW